MPGLGRLLVLGRRRRGRLLVVVCLAAAAGVVAAGPRVAAADECPSSNPPNMLGLVDGSPQTARLRTAFQTNLQVALANSNGCPVTGSLAGVAIRFVAPPSGASGTFASNGSNAAVVGTNAQGVATAPTFTANDTAGSYSVQADSDYGSVRLQLTNSAGGVVASIVATGTTAQDATVNRQYRQPLEARVLDADGRPVQGVTVSFSLATGATGASASFLGAGAQVTASTNANGQATSPPFVANAIPGRFTATAAVTPGGGGGGAEGGGGAVTGTVRPVSYRLANHASASRLTALTPARQTATVERRYRRPLRARLLDATGQPLEGANVTFRLPSAASGAGASFPGGASEATALTDRTGRASSPPLLANASAGRFTATAAVTPGGGGGEGGGAVTGTVKPVSYRLKNVAGRPATITVGAADGQQTAAGTRFPIPLAVTVKDANNNPVAGARVTFSAPAHGPSGRFRRARSGGRRARQARTVRVKANARGIAVAPSFTANAKSGGYVVIASAGRRRAAIALVNRHPSG